MLWVLGNLTLLIMKIKSIEDFTLEECKAYLNQNPEGSEKLAVEARMDTILKMMDQSRQKEEEQVRKEQEKYEKDVRWIDIKQFLAEHKYKCRNLSFILFISSISLIYALSIVLIWQIDGINDYLVGQAIILILIFLPLFIISLLYNSPSLSNIYNIEQDEKSATFRRTQNKQGKCGLYQCKKRRLVQVLPFAYDNIYYCGSDSYICIRGNKCGVYNTKRKGMVIDVCNDYIKILPDGTLDVFRNGNVSRFTADGYRVVE